MPRPYRILVLSRNYPNNLLPELGLWVKRLVHHCTGSCELKVISPVPYFPPIKGFEKYSRFCSIVRHSVEDDVEVFYPRFIVGFGKSIYPAEALSYYLGIRHTADKLHRESAFDLIHAHFTYPDGVVAAWLGRRYGVPVIITEHVPWRPTDKLTGHDDLWRRPKWIDEQRLVRWQALWAARECVSMIAVSNSVKDTIVYFTGQPEKVRIIPIGVDGSIFITSRDNVNKDQILYVGFINFNKGIDVLLKAFHYIHKKKPNVKLVIVGGGFYSNTMKQEKQLRSMAEKLELTNHIEFTGIKPPSEVAKYMRESALLVLPSRAESFGAVLVESIACGTPIVATKCGGPEDIITDKVGVLVQNENDEELAKAIEKVLNQQNLYDKTKLRDYAISKFSWERVANRTIDLYEETLKNGV